MQSLGTLLRNARHAQGLTQKAVARACGVGETYICHVEADYTVPSAAFLRTAAGVLRLDPLELMVAGRKASPVLEALCDKLRAWALLEDEGDILEAEKRRWELLELARTWDTRQLEDA